MPEHGHHDRIEGRRRVRMTSKSSAARHREDGGSLLPERVSIPGPASAGGPFILALAMLLVALASKIEARPISHMIDLPFNPGSRGEIGEFRVRGVANGSTGIRMDLHDSSGTWLGYIPGAAIQFSELAVLPNNQVWRMGVRRACRTFPGSNGCQTEPCTSQKLYLGALKIQDGEEIVYSTCGSIWYRTSSNYSTSYPAFTTPPPLDPAARGSFNGAGFARITYTSDISDSEYNSAPSPTLALDRRFSPELLTGRMFTASGYFEVADGSLPIDNLLVRVKTISGDVLSQAAIVKSTSPDPVEILGFQVAGPTTLGGKPGKRFGFSWPVPLPEGEIQVEVEVIDGYSKRAADAVLLTTVIVQKNPGPYLCNDEEKVGDAAVDTDTGGVGVKDEGLALEGPGGFEDSSGYHSFENNDGQRGPGWGSLADARLIPVTDGQKQKAILRLPASKRIEFEEASDGTFTACGCNDFSLTRVGTGYLVRTRSGETLDFDSQGFLRTRSDAAGNVIQNEYKADMKLAAVRSSHGQSLTYEYGANRKVTKVTDSAQRSVRYEYNASGKLAAAIDPAGFRTSYTYNAGGKLGAVIQQIGVTQTRTTFTASYDARGRVSRVYSRGEEATFDRDTSNKVTTVTRVGAAPVQIRYEEHGRMVGSGVMLSGSLAQRTSYLRDAETAAPTKITDALGRSTAIRYSPSVFPTSITAADGTTTSLSYRAINGVEKVEAVAFPSGGSMTFVRNDRGHVTRITDPSGQETIVTPNDRGQPTSIVTPGQSEISITYGTHGLPEEISRTQTGKPGTASVKTTYDLALNPKEVTDPRGYVTKTDWDARGLPTQITDPEKGVTKLEFNGGKELSKVTDPNNRITQYFRNFAGQLDLILNPLGQGTSMKYLRGSLVSEVKNFRQEVTAMSYDGEDRLISTKDPLLGEVKLAYNSASELETRTDPLNRTTRFIYTLKGQLDTQINPDGTELSYTYSPDGELKSVVDPRGREWVTERDANGRVHAIVDPTGGREELFYDPDGRVRTHKDRLGQFTHYGYDSQGRLEDITFHDARTYRLKYDMVGNLEQVESALGGKWDYTYDGLSRLKTAKDPRGNERRWSYDGAGNVTKIDEPGENSTRLVTAITYDALDRPKTITSPDRTTTITYNDNIKDVALKSSHDVVVTIQPGAITITRKLDALDRIVREIVTAGGLTTTLDYIWDQASNLIEVRQSTGSQSPAAVLAYTYDAMNRVKTITDVRRNRNFTLDYTDAGELETVTYPSGVTKVQTWGQRGELERIEYRRANGAVLRFLAYTVDANLQIKQIDDEQGMRAKYQYDSRGRLERADYRGGDFEAWTLDGNGNIATYTTQAGSETRTYDAADQVMTITRPLPAGGTDTIQHVHDPRGNLRRVVSASEVRELAWDAQGWLKAVTVGGAEKLRATYLDDYRLRSLQTPAYSTLFSWSMGNVVSEFDATAAETRFNVSTLELDSTLERGPPGVAGRETLVTDHLQSVLGGLDDSGNPTIGTDYGAYGGIRGGTDPGAHGFAGARRDAGTGYLYLRNRWMDPKTGRFLSRDPIGFQGGWNQYQYVSGNPIGKRDPSGLVDPITGVIGAVAIGGAVWSQVDPEGFNDFSRRVDDVLLTGLGTVAAPFQYIVQKTVDPAVKTVFGPYSSEAFWNTLAIVGGGGFGPRPTVPEVLRYGAGKLSRRTRTGSRRGSYTGPEPAIPDEDAVRLREAITQQLGREFDVENIRYADAIADAEGNPLLGAATNLCTGEIVLTSHAFDPHFLKWTGMTGPRELLAHELAHRSSTALTIMGDVSYLTLESVVDFIASQNSNLTWSQRWNLLQMSRRRLR